MSEVNTVQGPFGEYPSRTYIGIGPLRVDTPRGELKAESGDTIVYMPGGPFVFPPTAMRLLFNEDFSRLSALLSGQSISEYLDKSSPTYAGDEKRLASSDEEIKKGATIQTATQEQATAESVRQSQLEIERKDATVDPGAEIPAVNLGTEDHGANDPAKEKTTIEFPNAGEPGKSRVDNASRGDVTTSPDPDAKAPEPDHRVTPQSTVQDKGQTF